MARKPKKNRKAHRALSRAKARAAAREAKALSRLRDVGRDESGNYGVNPYAARGHIVEMARKDLGNELPKDSQFPKRIATQRVIDRYLARGHISQVEWRAAEALRSLWDDAGLEAKVTSGYDPVMVQSSANTDGRIAARLDGVIRCVELMKAVPHHSRGIVRAVVIEDWTVTDWELSARRRSGDSCGPAFDLLRAGLSALAVHLRY